MAFGIDDVASYPLFTPELVDLMRRVVPVDHQSRVAVRIMASARRPR